ncbi:MAG TPA: hypothetical protein VHB02_14850 [Acidimicrobiales bacterium]|nr:hypothetical protein [Acidimicrobiales bacterium]
MFIWLKPHYPIPRHHHSDDCMYYVISGSLLMGGQTLQGGDALYIPAGAPYAYDAGPDGAEVLEIRRGAWRADIHYLDAERPEVWATMMATLAAHKGTWETMEVSPTLAGT